jgi:signal transduction histidine kinase
VGLKLALCYLLIGLTGGVSSSFYLTLLLPVISAATSFSWTWTALVTGVACLEYGSFLLFLDWRNQFIPEDQLRELALRLLVLPAAGILTHQLAQANREEARKLQEAEAQVRRADRLAALGQLTAGLAHELRNPLGTMKTSAEMLLRNVGQENAVAREMASYVAEEVDRTNSLITRFLDFARPQHLRMEREDVNALLDRAVARFEREGNKIPVFKNFAPEVPTIPLDRELMERVILNLLANAAQASAADGVITLKTRLAEGTVEVSVIDRGCGIAAKNLETIFNPFFTTKPDGVGLGLAICSKIVHEHGGQIAVESAEGEGSVFRVYLPVGD